MMHASVALAVAAALAAPAPTEAPPVAPPAPAVSMPAQSPATSVPATAPLEPSVEPAVPMSPKAAREHEIQHDPELRRQDRRAEALVITGSVGLGLGLGSLLLVTAPTHALYRNALEDAEQARWVTDRDEPLARAAYRRRVMLVSAGIGTGVAAVGAVLLGVGLRRRALLRRPDAATLSVAPVVGGGHYGVSASLRF